MQVGRSERYLHGGAPDQRWEASDDQIYNNWSNEKLSFHRFSNRFSTFNDDLDGPSVVLAV